MRSVLRRRGGVLGWAPASGREQRRSWASSDSTASTAKGPCQTPQAPTPLWTGCRSLLRAQAAGGDPLRCKVGLPLAKAPDARYPLCRRRLSYRLRRDHGLGQPPPDQEHASQGLRTSPSLGWRGREATSREKPHRVRAAHRPADLWSVPVVEREALHPAHPQRPQRDSRPPSGRGGLSADEDDAGPDLGPRPEASSLRLLGRLRAFPRRPEGHRRDGARAPLARRRRILYLGALAKESQTHQARRLLERPRRRLR